MRISDWSSDVCSSDLNAMRLTALDELAGKAGLRRGQGLAEARAAHPKLDVMEEDPRADQALLEAVADWSDRYTPLVAIDGEDGLLLDITGCAHLFGGEEALLNDALLRLFQMGFAARGAVAGCPGLSWAACRFGRGGVVDDKGGREIAQSLPVASLRIAEGSIASLHKFGLQRVGDLLSLPRASLARRFGQQVLRRLDQIIAAAAEPLSTIGIASVGERRGQYGEI